MKGDFPFLQTRFLFRQRSLTFSHSVFLVHCLTISLKKGNFYTMSQSRFFCLRTRKNGILTGSKCLHFVYAIYVLFHGLQLNIYYKVDIPYFNDGRDSDSSWLNKQNFKSGLADDIEGVFCDLAVHFVPRKTKKGY